MQWYTETLHFISQNYNLNIFAVYKSRKQYHFYYSVECVLQQQQKSITSVFFLVFMSQLHIRKGVIKIIGTHAVLAGSYLYTTCIFYQYKKCSVYIILIFFYIFFAINQLKGATVFIIPCKMGYSPLECKIHGSFAGKL